MPCMSVAYDAMFATAMIHIVTDTNASANGVATTSTPTRKSVPKELSAIAQRKAWPARAEFAGGRPTAVSTRVAPCTPATATEVAAAAVATRSAPTSTSRPRFGNSSQAEPAPRYATVRTPPAR